MTDEQYKTIIMEDTELKNIWQAYDAKLEQSKLLNLQSWVINLKTFESLQQHKAGMTLDSLARFKTRVLAVGILWTAFLAVLVIGDWFRHPYFTVSLGAILLFNIVTDLIYIRDIVLIKSVAYTESITVTQTKLSKLESSALSLRFLWLQVPFYSTFFWSSNWIHYDRADFWLITFPITFLLTMLGVYIYRNATAANLHKKWVRALLMAGPEYKSIIKAKEFLAEIETFRTELA